MKILKDPIKAITVCGLGVGSSIILRMTADRAFKELGIDVELDSADISSARSMNADIIIGQSIITEEVEGLAPIVISINNFTDVNSLKEKILNQLVNHGWVSEE